MRTTIEIDIDDELMLKLTALAAQSHRPLDDVIEDALRESIHKHRERAVVQLPTINGGELRPGVDLDDTSAILDLMDGITR
jgi:predicted transcriptional regulator